MSQSAVKAQEAPSVNRKATRLIFQKRKMSVAAFLFRNVTFKSTDNMSYLHVCLHQVKVAHMWLCVFHILIACLGHTVQPYNNDPNANML